MRRSRALFTERERRVYDALIERYLRYRLLRDHTIAAVDRLEAARKAALDHGDPMTSIQMSLLVERERLAGIREVVTALTDLVHGMER